MRIIGIFLAFFISLSISFLVQAEPSGTIQVQDSEIFKPTKAKFYCGLVKGKWVPGRLIRKSGNFYPHKVERKNALKKAKKASGAIADRLYKKAEKLKLLNKVRSKDCGFNSSGKALRFNFSGAVGLVLYDEYGYFGEKLPNGAKPTNRSGSNLYKLGSSGQLLPTAASGRARIADVVIGPDDSVYIIFYTSIDIENTSIKKPKDGCAIAKIARETGVPTCLLHKPAGAYGVSGTKKSSNFQFDKFGAVYFPYLAKTANSNESGGDVERRVILRKIHNNKVIDLYNQNMMLSHFRVFPEGQVYAEGLKFKPYFEEFSLIIPNNGQIRDMDPLAGPFYAFPNQKIYSAIGWQEFNPEDGSSSDHNLFNLLSESLVPISPEVNFLSNKMTANTNETIFINNKGQVQCMGSGSCNMLPYSFTASALIQDVAKYNNQLVDIAGGYEFGCLLSKTGQVQCWGRNYHGSVGDGTKIDRDSPQDVVGLSSGVKALNVGYEHSCAITHENALKCWGRNRSGCLGNNSFLDNSAPVQVAGLTSGVKEVRAGFRHTCATTFDGVLKCWGRGYEGQLGTGGFSDRKVPWDVVGLGAGVKAFSTGEDFTCAVTSADALKCWGINNKGQLGNGSTTRSATPTQVVGLTSGVLSVTAGKNHACAITTTGVKCWGANENGQLGNNSKISSLEPVTVQGLSSNVSALALGNNHTCAIDSGNVKCWGSNFSTQLGHWSYVPASSKSSIEISKSGEVYSSTSKSIIKIYPKINAYNTVVTEIEKVNALQNYLVIVGKDKSTRQIISAFNLFDNSEHLLYQDNHRVSIEGIHAIDSISAVVMYGYRNSSDIQHKLLLIKPKTLEVLDIPLITSNRGISVVQIFQSS